MDRVELVQLLCEMWGDADGDCGWIPEDDECKDGLNYVDNVNDYAV